MVLILGRNGLILANRVSRKTVLPKEETLEKQEKQEEVKLPAALNQRGTPVMTGSGYLSSPSIAAPPLELIKKPRYLNEKKKRDNIRLVL